MTKTVLKQHMKPALDHTVRIFLQAKLEDLEKELNSDMHICTNQKVFIK